MTKLQSKEDKSNSSKKNSSSGGVKSQNLMKTPLMQKKAKTHNSIFSNNTIQKKENNTGLPDNLKSGMESLSGMDLSHVQVNYNSSKPASVGAHAFAQGNQIHLASGQEKHLPHELGHIVQQAQGRVQPTATVNGTAINDNPALENEADVMGARALQMKSKDKVLKNTFIKNKVIQKITLQNVGNTNWLILNSKNFKEFIQASPYYAPIGKAYINLWLKNQNKQNILKILKTYKKQNQTEVQKEITEPRKNIPIKKSSINRNINNIITKVASEGRINIQLTAFTNFQNQISNNENITAHSTGGSGERTNQIILTNQDAKNILHRLENLVLKGYEIYKKETQEQKKVFLSAILKLKGTSCSNAFITYLGLAISDLDRFTSNPNENTPKIDEIDKEIEEAQEEEKRNKKIEQDRLMNEKFQEINHSIKNRMIILKNMQLFKINIFRKEIIKSLKYSEENFPTEKIEQIIEDIKKGEYDTTLLG